MSNDYLPDSIYTICGEFTQDCNICSNVVWSPVVNANVHDALRGKDFCPFGKGDSMNKTTYGDQGYLNVGNIFNNNNYVNTTWGKAPQLDPRPLAKIGLSWRTS